MEKRIVSTIDISNISKEIKKFPAFHLCADLYIRRLDIAWNEDEKNAEVVIANRGYRDSGSFMIYFDLEEEPISRNHRPQVRLWIDNLRPNSEITKHADFTHLMHPDNHYLENVYEIIVLVDPKNMVNECNENNNREEKELKEFDKPIKEFKEKDSKEFDKAFDKPIKEFKEKESKEFKEKESKEFKEKESKEFKEKDKDLVENIPVDNHLEKIFNRLEVIEKQLASGKSFISKDERPDIEAKSRKKK